MLAALQSVFAVLITMIGQVITALVGTTGAWKDLLELFVIGIAVSVVLLSVKVIRKVVWGA